nr:Flp pilus assembly protein CpaB [uncultured Rhodopila sp.]
MAVRIALFLLIGLGLAGIAVTVVVGLRPAPAPVQIAAPQEVVAPKAQILASARVIRGGTLLLPDDVVSKTVLPAEVPAGAWVDSLDTRAAIQGAMVRHQIEPGQPILHDDVVRPGERGFLAAVLSPGSRAATIGVDAVSGTAGLIWPGDRVDVILTQKIEDATAPIGRRVVGETVIQNARVIAVDQHMTEGVAPGTALSNNIVARTVTIEVLAKEAEKVSVAATLGHLAVVVRSASEPAPVAEDHPVVASAASDSLVWSSDVSAAFRASPRNPDTTIHLFTGPQANAVEYHY